MKKKSLTKVERLNMKARKECLPKGLAPTLKGLKTLMRNAFHEAGHVAARMFTALEASHVVSVSIIPSDNYMGLMGMDDCFTEVTLGDSPKEMMQRQGNQFLMCFLSGRASEELAFDYKREDVLEINSDEWEIEGSDLYRAMRVAHTMAGKRAWKILERAEAWTTEMLEIPLVWKTVEKLASILIKKGSIEGNDRIMDLCDKIYMMGFLMPEWKKRLMGENQGAGRMVELGKLKK